MIDIQSAAQWISLLATCALFGTLCFERVCLRGAGAAEIGRVTADSRKHLAWIALAACAVAAAFAMAVPPRFLSPEFRWGLGVARLGGVVATWVMLRSGRLGVATALAGALLAAQTASSRILAMPNALIPLLADFAHLLAAAVWLGGVSTLGLALVPAALRAPNLTSGLSAAIRRFSPLAVGCVLILALTGLAQANLVLDGFDALFSTGYGQTLIVKVMLFGGLIGFGALHQRVLAPRLLDVRGRANTWTPETLTMMRKTLRVEIGLAAATLGAAAILVAWPNP